MMRLRIMKLAASRGVGAMMSVTILQQSCQQVGKPPLPRLTERSSRPHIRFAMTKAGRTSR
jgi:hypothetical protein